MITQYDRDLNKALPGLDETGCAVLLPFWTASRFNDLRVDRDLIIKRIKKWIKLEWVDGNGYYINRWGPIHRDLGVPVKYFGHVEPSEYMVPADDYFAYGYFKYGKLGHFMALNRDLGTSYDPLGYSVFQRKGELQTLRLFKRANIGF